MCLSSPPFARGAAQLLVVACALALSACDDGPVLTDVDGGPGDDAGPVLDAGVDAGGMDAGSTDAGTDAGADAGTDAGPPCHELEPAPAADPTAGAWLAQYANPGVGGGFRAGVSAFAFGADGTVYVGGSFTKAGYTTVSNVAAWDGTTGWHALGDGLPGGVSALAVGDDGSVYAVHRADGEVRIGRWDGASWSTFAVADGSIFELAVVDGTLFAVGAFTTIGGVAHANVAYHDGTSWQGYAGLAPDAYVSAISATTMDDVCIGGPFTTLGVVAAQNVACWDGSAWSARGLPPPPPPGPLGPTIVWLINQLGRDPADGALVAAGFFDLDDTNTQGSSIARWTGTEWALIGGGLMQFGPGDIATVAGFAFTPSGLYVGGNMGYANASMDPLTEVDGAARWDGTSWHSMGTLDHRAPIGFPGSDPGPVGVVAGGPDGSVYFGGLLHRADSLAVGHVVRWDGTYWKGLRTDGERYDGVSGTVSALARRGTCEIYVGGTFKYAGEIRANSVASYTLEAGYQPLGDGVDGTVRDLFVAEDGRVYAVGDFVDSTGTAFRNVAVWDGIEWRGLGSGVGDPSQPFDEIVKAIAVADGTVYVGGSFTQAGGERATNLAMWDGTAWADLGAGMTGYEDRDGNVGPSDVTSLAIDPATGDLVVAGRFSAIGGLTTNNIARWDGSAWHPFGAGAGTADSTVLAMTVWEGRIAVARGFVEDDPLRFAVWNGTAWEPIGAEQPVPTVVTSIDGVGETFFLTGNASGTGHVFVYDGSAWSELGMGVSDEVPEAILVSEGGVYVGGGFDRAGETPSAGIARWQYTP